MRQTVAVSLPVELTEELDRAAGEEGSSRSELVRDALRRYLAVRRFRAVRNATLPFAEAEGFISDEDVFQALSRGSCSTATSLSPRWERAGCAPSCSSAS